MKLAELILEYLKVIIWPSLILGIVLIFRKQIDSRIRDLQKADLPGGVSFSFRAKFCPWCHSMRVRMSLTKPDCVTNLPQPVIR